MLAKPDFPDLQAYLIECPSVNQNCVGARTGANQAPRTIKAKGIIFEIRSGLPDFQLAEKYHVSLRSLDSLLRYRVDSGLITEAEPAERDRGKAFGGRPIFIHMEETVKAFERISLFRTIPV